MMETMKPVATRHEVTLPADALLGLLRDARAAGDESLRERGRAAGRRLADRLGATQSGPAAARSLPIAVFWKRVAELFSSRGWGTLQHVAAQAGLGELRSSDWIEADRSTGSGCGFTAGMIEGLLTSVGGDGLLVEEVECRAGGGARCRFLFGTAAAHAAAAAHSQAAGGA